MPLWLIEIALLGALAFASLRTLKMGFARLAGRLAASGAAALLAGGLLWLTFPLLNAGVRNIVLRLSIAAVICVASYIAFQQVLLRLVFTPARAWVRRLAGRMSARGGAVLAGLCVAILWMAALAALDLAGELISASPWRQPVERHTLVLRYFLLPASDGSAPLAGTGAPPDAAGADADENQHRLLTGIGRDIAGARRYLAQVTGTQKLAAQVDALRTITNLSYEDRAWVLGHNPDVLALLKDPDVARVVGNRHVADLIDQVSDGSLTAIYALGDEPDVQRLFDDDRVRPLLTRLDPAEMVRQLQVYRRAQARPVHVAWRATQLAEPTQLDAALGNAAAWSDGSDAPGPGQRWPVGTRWGVLAANLSAATAPERLLTLDTPGQPLVWWGNKAVTLSGGEGHWLASLPATPQATPIEVLIDFRGVPGQPACRLWIAAGEAADAGPGAGAPVAPRDHFSR